PVVVVGGGPLGLVSAIRAFQSGKKVVVLEKRTAYTRDQIMGLDPHFMEWIDKTSPDLAKLMRSLGVLTDRTPWTDLGNAEVFTSVRTQQLESSLALLAHQLQLAYPDAFRVVRGAEVVDQKATSDGFKVIAIDGPGRKTEYPAKIVVGADGA